MQYNTIFTHCAEVSDSNYALLTAEQLELTQAERCFIVQFLADTLVSLTSINNECVVEREEYFMRETDLHEVLANLTMLYNTMSEDGDVAHYTFTLADAGAALCSYDTEYRECIAEQFEDACDNAAKTAKITHNNTADFTTLALRVLLAY